MSTMLLKYNMMKNSKRTQLNGAARAPRVSGRWQRILELRKASCTDGVSDIYRRWQDAVGDIRREKLSFAP